MWNYNKSRIHSYRGAKEITISLDSTVIFKGEVARACGGLAGGTEAYGDTILFTENEDILDQVNKPDIMVIFFKPCLCEYNIGMQY